MSKAFTRESDDVPERPVVRRSAGAGAADGSSLTPAGARRFREELGRLIEVERPLAAALGDSPDARQRMRLLDQRIQVLQEILGSAVIVTPPAGSEDRVGFGAVVTVRGGGGEASVYRLVGPLEIDLDPDGVSWRSPMGRALLNSRKGDRVRVRLPSGEEEFEILEVRYREFET